MSVLKRKNELGQWEPIQQVTSNALTLGGKPPEYYLQPRNLLDNSDFTNPVNQRGQTIYSSEDGKYIFDRWIKRGAGSDTTIELTADGAKITKLTTNYSALKQPINLAERPLAGKTITFAIKAKESCNAILRITGAAIAAADTHIYAKTQFSGAGIHTLTTTLPETLNYEYLSVCIMLNEIGSATVEWAALYEGSYTAETLPPYVPKGYGVELVECQRYYRKYSNPTGIHLYCYMDGYTAGFNFGLPMRIAPSFSGLEIRKNSDYTLATVGTGHYASAKAVSYFNVTGATTGEWYRLVALELKADL